MKDCSGNAQGREGKIVESSGHGQGGYCESKDEECSAAGDP